MQVVRLQIKNFMSISDAEILPKQVNQIIGKNNQGKSTIIKALAFAIKGSSDGSLVKFGEDSSEVIVELSDQTVISRRMNADGRQSVSVKREGFKSASPQSYLDAIFADNAFNPLEILDPKKRNDAILSAIDLKVDPLTLGAALRIAPEALPIVDFQQHGLKVLEGVHRFYYQRRAEANKDAADKKKRWETYKADLPTNSAPPPKSREALHDEIATIKVAQAGSKAKLAAIAAEREAARKSQERINKYSAALKKIDDEIARLQTSWEVEKARLLQGQKMLDEAVAELPKQIPDELPIREEMGMQERDLSMLQLFLKDHETADAVARQVAQVKKLEHEFQSAQLFAESITETVEALAGPIKNKFMSAAEMPIAGLEYKDGSFLVEGVPIDNLSSSKFLRLAVGVARKLARKNKLICIDGAEQLDEESYQALRAEIENDGYIYFVTKVGDCFLDPRDQIIKMEAGKNV